MELICCEQAVGRRTLKMGMVDLMDLKATVVMEGSPQRASSGISRMAAAKADVAFTASSVASTKPCIPTCRIAAQAVAIRPPLLHPDTRLGTQLLHVLAPRSTAAARRLAASGLACGLWVSSPLLLTSGR